MPFKSTAQRGYLYANHPEVAAEFEKATPKGAKLPKHVAKKRKKSAPMPAYSLPAAADQGKAMRTTTGEIADVNRLRNTRLKTSGGYG